MKFFPHLTFHKIVSPSELHCCFIYWIDSTRISSQPLTANPTAYLCKSWLQPTEWSILRRMTTFCEALWPTQLFPSSLVSRNHLDRVSLLLCSGAAGEQPPRGDGRCSTSLWCSPMLWTGHIFCVLVLLGKGNNYADDNRSVVRANLIVCSIDALLQLHNG